MDIKEKLKQAVVEDLNLEEITPEDIGMLSEQVPVVIGDTFYEKVEGYKEQLVREALEKASGNQAKAARMTGLSYHQYRYYLRKYVPSGT